MKNRLIRLHLIICLAVLSALADPALALEKRDIISVLKKITDYSLQNPQVSATDSDGKPMDLSLNGWVMGVYYAGVAAVYSATKDSAYKTVLDEWGASTRWSPGPLTPFADDVCVCQAYLDFYSEFKTAAYILPCRLAMEKHLADQISGRKLWWWVDSLFMAPPVMTRLGHVSRNEAYFEVMDRLWIDSEENLYDPSENLFYRDAKYKIDDKGNGPRTKNGKKIFWARGNGWAFAGLARVLQDLPESFPNRRHYELLFKEMAARLAKLQGTDGLWSPSLLDYQEYPCSEVSSSALFCYGIAWGINNKLLEKDVYFPVMVRAWQGLQKDVEPNGRVGWIQMPGEQPAMVAKEDSMPYGVGALMLAGSEVLKLAQ